MTYGQSHDPVLVRFQSHPTSLVMYVTTPRARVFVDPRPQDAVKAELLQNIRKFLAPQSTQA